jgi:hypothetical protein
MCVHSGRMCSLLEACIGRSAGHGHWPAHLHLHVVEACSMHGFELSVILRGTLHVQDRARDSLENFLFSVCRFRQFVGTYPTRFTVVSYNFKKERFLNQHAAALGIPQHQITYLGTPAIDNEAALKVRPICNMPWFTVAH